MTFNFLGLFLTDSADSLKRAWFYCRKCHANIKSEKAVAKCGCKRTAVRMVEKDHRHPAKIPKKYSGADKVPILRPTKSFSHTSNAVAKLLAC